MANGNKLKAHAYLSMTVSLTSASYYPTTFEWCPVNNKNGIMLTLQPASGSWKKGDNTVLMNLDSLGNGIYKDTPTWSNMNRLEMYMNEKSKTTSDQITLKNVRLKIITPSPTFVPTHVPSPSPTEHPTTRPPSPSPSHTPTESPTHSPTPTPTADPSHVPSPSPTKAPTNQKASGSTEGLILNNKVYVAKSNQYGGIGAITLGHDTIWTAMANGNKLKAHAYLSMTVSLTSASYYPTTFEWCPVNNKNGIMLTLQPASGSWKKGDNTVLMNLDSLGNGIYKDTPTWSNMNRLELYMNEKSKTTSDTITLVNVRLKIITPSPTLSPTAEVKFCHCNDCKDHYKTNGHVETSPEICGSTCQAESRCKFALFNPVTTKCYYYDKTEDFHYESGSEVATFCYHKA